jgi:hypothetical protein
LNFQLPKPENDSELPLEIFQFKMRLVFALLAPILVIASPLGISGTGDTPDPNQIQIVSASSSGNGCPQGTVTTDISPDRTVSKPIPADHRQKRKTMISLGSIFSSKCIGFEIASNYQLLTL